MYQPESNPHLNDEALSLTQNNASRDDTHPVLHILTDGREGSCLLPSSCASWASNKKEMKLTGPGTGIQWLVTMVFMQIKSLL